MLQRAAKIVQDCENQLQDLIAEASRAGDYDAVDRITNWARTLSSLSRQAMELDAGSPSEISLKPSAAAVAAGKRSRLTGKGKLYPSFSRVRNELIKTGWSKKEKREYQHRAPWGVAEALAKCLNGFAGRVFTTDEIFPLILSDGSEIPSYQAYLCLAWFRVEKLVVQDGRHGYYISPDIDALARARQMWKEMG